MLSNNLAQQQALVGKLTDPQLAQELQRPSGLAPGYLIMAEMQKRAKMRATPGMVQPPGPTVKDQMLMQMMNGGAPLGVGSPNSPLIPMPPQAQANQPPGPPPNAQGGIAGLTPQKPQTMQLPKGFADGGPVNLEDVDFSSIVPYVPEAAPAPQDPRAAMWATITGGGWGLSPAGAAALMSHAQHESSFSPSANNKDDPNGGSHGLFQWNGPRWQAMRNYALNNGQSPYDFNSQLGYAREELKTQYPDLWTTLQNTNDPAEAAKAMASYERYSGWDNPNNRETADRVATANNIYSQHGGQPVAASPVTPGGGSGQYGSYSPEQLGDLYQKYYQQFAGNAPQVQGIQEILGALKGSVDDPSAAYAASIKNIQDQLSEQRAQSKAMALMKFGLGMMNAHGGNFLSALGEGGAAGLDALQQGMAQTNALRTAAAQAQLQQAQAKAAYQQGFLNPAINMMGQEQQARENALAAARTGAAAVLSGANDPARFAAQAAQQAQEQRYQQQKLAQDKAIANAEIQNRADIAGLQYGDREQANFGREYDAAVKAATEAVSRDMALNGGDYQKKADAIEYLTLRSLANSQRPEIRDYATAKLKELQGSGGGGGGGGGAANIDWSKYGM